MSDTPYTDSHIHTYGNGVQNWNGQWVPAIASRCIEREMNVYKERIDLVLKRNIELSNKTAENKRCIHQLERSLQRAKDKIKKMKISGNELAEAAETLGWTDSLAKWRKAREAK